MGREEYRQGKDGTASLIFIDVTAEKSNRMKSEVYRIILSES